MTTVDWDYGYDTGFEAGYKEAEGEFSDDSGCDCSDEIEDLKREIELADMNPRYVVKVADLIRKYKKMDLSKNDALSDLENELDIFLQCGV